MIGGIVIAKLAYRYFILGRGDAEELAQQKTMSILLAVSVAWEIIEYYAFGIGAYGTFKLFFGDAIGDIAGAWVAGLLAIVL
jgi:hypothetical protein